MSAMTFGTMLGNIIVNVDSLIDAILDRIDDINNITVKMTDGELNADTELTDELNRLDKLSSHLAEVKWELENAEDIINE